MNTARTSTPPADAMETEILSSDDVGRTVARIAHQIIEKTALDADDAKRVVLLGIPQWGRSLSRAISSPHSRIRGSYSSHGGIGHHPLPR